MSDATPPTVFEQLVAIGGNRRIGGAMDYVRFPGAWVSERKYGALMCRLDHKPSTAATKDTKRGWQVKVTSANVTEMGNKLEEAITAALAKR